MRISVSFSLYKNITTALKENVNNADLQSQNVDDFWATERQKSTCFSLILSCLSVPSLAMLRAARTHSAFPSFTLIRVYKSKTWLGGSFVGDVAVILIPAGSRL